MMAAQKVKVTVVHGSVGYADHPVAVGHYEGDVITSAESHLNRCRGGRLSLRHRLGLYPGALETAEIVLNPDRYAKPGGAIVLGLGAVGGLTPANLVRTFTHAALLYAVAVLESSSERFLPKDGPRSAALTTLLIGTGESGISIQDAVKAILQGVRQANLLLSQKGYDNRTVIDAVEFMELWEDRTIQAARALELMRADPELEEHFDFSQLLIRQAPGGRSRVVFNEFPNWWRRLQILGDDEGSLQFSVMTDRSRTEVSLLPTQRALVDQFIDKAIRYTGSEAGVGRTLFELLIPNRLKEQVRNRQNLVLLLNEEAARYPWELLEDRSSESGHPFTVEMGVLRQLEITEFRERPILTAQSSALVIGDPKSSLVPLPAAQEEAQAVWGRLLSYNYQVETKICASALEIVEALYANTYRILHLAGHGAY